MRKEGTSMKKRLRELLIWAALLLVASLSLAAVFGFRWFAPRSIRTLDMNAFRRQTERLSELGYEEVRADPAEADEQKAIVLVGGPEIKLPDGKELYCLSVLLPDDPFVGRWSASLATSINWQDSPDGKRFSHTLTLRSHGSKAGYISLFRESDSFFAGRQAVVRDMLDLYNAVNNRSYTDLS